MSNDVDDFRRLSKEYKQCCDRLNTLRNQILPVGSVVKVSGVGLGIVVATETGDIPDQFPVVLENGNCWWYPIDRIEVKIPESNSDQWPSWIRRLKWIKI